MGPICRRNARPVALAMRVYMKADKVDLNVTSVLDEPPVGAFEALGSWRAAFENAATARQTAQVQSEQVSASVAAAEAQMKQANSKADAEAAAARAAAQSELE